MYVQEREEEEGEEKNGLDAHEAEVEFHFA